MRRGRNTSRMVTCEIVSVTDRRKCLIWQCIDGLSPSTEIDQLLYIPDLK